MNSLHKEHHPLPLFGLPDARILMLGSFPPARERWSINFYYPNFNNDMWRIFGLVFFGERDYFVQSGTKAFDRERIVAFLAERGIAIGDTAHTVMRLRNNASDAFLQVITPIDLRAALTQMPHCTTIATTGQKATDTLLTLISACAPEVGGSSEFTFCGNQMHLYRMPSSSRAYPKPLAEKAAMYKRMFENTGIL